MRLTSVTIEVTCCQVVVPNLVRVKTEDAIRGGAVGIRDLETRQSISSSNINIRKTYRGLLLEDDVTQELAKKCLELSRTIN